MVLLHSGKLLEYPNNPFAEEALIARAEVQFNQMQTADALASYKMLKEKASTSERRLLAETGILRSGHLLKEDAETIHAATALLAEAKLTPELKSEALYYRAKAYLNRQAGKKATDDLRELAKDTATGMARRPNICWLNRFTTRRNTPPPKRSCSTTSTKARPTPIGWHGVSYSFRMCMSPRASRSTRANTC